MSGVYDRQQPRVLPSTAILRLEFDRLRPEVLEAIGTNKLLSKLQAERRKREEDEEARLQEEVAREQ